MQACFADIWLRILLSWVLGTGIVGFLVMGIDKLRAINHSSRIPEVALFTMSLTGGVFGILLGALAFHHKTSKRAFLLVVFGSLAIWLLLLQRIDFIQCLAGTF